MFSGLVEAKTAVAGVIAEEGGIRLVLDRPGDYADIALGDSVAVSGCCLTVVEANAHSLHFQAGRETLAKTTLGSLQVGGFVNCERSLALGDRLGGHLVTGHVDGVGRLSQRVDLAEWSDMTFSCPAWMSRQMVPKGSITVAGVSLTLVTAAETSFSVALIPHTLQETTLGDLQAGDSVNLETDLLAKYVQRQLGGLTAEDRHIER